MLEKELQMMVKYCCMVLLLFTSSQCCIAQDGQAETPFARQRAHELIEDLPAQIKKLDEATVRVFLQLRLATFYWSESSEQFRERARDLTLDGLRDLDEHRSDLIPLDADSFRKDLLALLEVHAPDLAARYRSGGDTTDKVTTGNPYDVAHAMLRTKGQAALAVQTFTRALRDGETPTQIITFFLSELQRQEPSLVPQLLSDILSAQERRPGTLSVEILFWLVDPCVWQNNGDDIKRRFLSVIVAATADSYQWSDLGQLTSAFNLLRVAVPLIQKLIPALYPQAAAQLATVRARLPNETVERSAIAERIRQSGDTLNQLQTEANSASSPSLKTELLIQAAELAFTKRKLQLSFDLTTSISTDDTDIQNWRQQFYGELVKGAVENKDTQLGLAIAAKIEKPLPRAEALQRLAVLFFNLKDIWKARELLSESLKLIRGSENTPDKAVSLLRNLRVVAKVDQALVPDVAEDSIKALNALQLVAQGEKAPSEKSKSTLMVLAWTIVPSFEALAQWDELGTLNFVDKIQRTDLRAAAGFGAAKAILTIANAQDATSKKPATKP